MDRLLSKVTRVLKQAFPRPDQVDLKDEDGIYGTVISSRFKGKDSNERINLIWDLLEKELLPEERKRVVLIIAVTPEEEIAHTGG